MNKEEEERGFDIKIEEFPLFELIGSVEHVFEHIEKLFEHIEKLKENIIEAEYEILGEAEDQDEAFTLSPGMCEAIRQSMKKLRRSEHIDGNQ